MKLLMQFFAFSLLLCLFTSCKKISRPPENLPAPQPEVPNLPKYRSVDVGAGSGDLVVDGSVLSLNCYDTIKIAAGSYNTITLKNIRADSGCHVMVINKGLVEFDGNFKQMNLSNLEGVVISGNGDPSLPYGFQFRNNNSRSVNINSPYNRVTLQFCSFKDIYNWVIRFSNETEFNGTTGSYSRDLKFLNILGENTASLIQIGGNVEREKVTGFIKGLEVANLNYSNSEVGGIVFIGNVEDFDIHHNRIDNINQNSSNHNGIFHIRGNGKFHDNYISNHQGNAIRAWTVSVGTEPKNVLIYNNIVVGSKKYSAFETQSFDTYLGSKTTFANTQIFNNTCGNINMSKDWYGGVADVYNLQGGTCKIFNNLGFNFPSANPGNKIVNQQSSTIPQLSNNLYFDTKEEVGFLDEAKFTLHQTSAAKNKGEPVPYLTSDYYNHQRSATVPSIGATE